MPVVKQKKADMPLLIALACGATVENAARQVGLSDRTIYRRLKDPEFRRQVQATRADMVQRTAGTLTAAATEAVKTLLDLQKGTQPAAVRLGAARAVLEVGIKLREVADLEARVAALEEQVASQEPVLAAGADELGLSAAAAGNSPAETVRGPDDREPG